MCSNLPGANGLLSHPILETTMAYFILILTLILSGCSVLDVTARHGVAQHSILKLNNQYRMSVNEVAGTEWRFIDFCQHWHLENAVPLHVYFDCQLSTIEIERYKRVLTQYHPELINRLQHSSLADVLPLQVPPCLYIIPAKAMVHRYNWIDPCLSIYMQSSGLKKYDVDPIRNDQAFFIQLSMEFYANWLHEAFHAETWQSWSTSESSAFANHWINEYIAYLIDDFTNFTALNLVNQKPKNRITLIENDPYWKYILQEDCRWADLKEDKWFMRSSDRSAVGLIFRESLLDSLHTIPSMLPFYYAAEIQALSDPRANFQTLKNRIPRCNSGKLGEVFALKHRLMDYDFAHLNSDAGKNEVGLNDLPKSIFHRTADLSDPFTQCQRSDFSDLLVQICSAFWLDFLTLHQYEFTSELSTSDFKLPQQAHFLLPRFQLLIEDAKLRGAQGPSQKFSSTTYWLEQDGRFRSETNWVADTGSPLNVWPKADEYCNFQGQQQVKTLAGSLKTLHRCRFEPSIGVLWQSEQQQEKVVGLPTLMAQNAILMKDAASLRYAEKVPFIFQDGFLVFQQDDQGIRLNLCLDTGSPRSYLTPRYQERYQISHKQLDSDLESENVNKSERLINWPLLGETRRLKIFPSDTFMQCDVIVGSDLLQHFSAIEIHPTHLTLWHKTKPLNQ